MCVSTKGNRKGTTLVQTWTSSSEQDPHPEFFSKQKTGSIPYFGVRVEFLMNSGSATIAIGNRTHLVFQKSRMMCNGFGR